MKPVPLTPITPELRANARRLYFDIGWYGIVIGTTIAFLTIYITRLGATGFQIALITAGPGVVNLFLSLPAGRFLAGKPIVKSTLRSAALQRLGFFALLPLPFLAQYAQQVWAAILITLLMAVPGTLVAIAFNSLFADVIPPDYRATVVGRRNAIVSVVGTVTALVSGQVLVSLDFPYGYAVVFTAGAVGALMSTYYLSRITTPQEPPIRIGKPLGFTVLPLVILRLGSVMRHPGQRFLMRMKGKPLLQLSILRGPFGAYMLAVMAFYIAQNAPLPLFPQMYVRVLELPDDIISLGTAVFNVMMMLVSLLLPRLAAFGGHRSLLVAGALAFCAHPLIIAFAQGAESYLAANVISGMIWGVLNGGLINRLMERIPEDDRPAHLAVHNVVLNLGILVGSLLGPALEGWMDIREALLLTAGLRFAAGLLLLVWG
jgi:MFS family permease